MKNRIITISREFGSGGRTIGKKVEMCIRDRLCRERNIPVNVADPGTESTFLFPSVVRRGPLTVGISTGGKSPSAAHYLKEQIEGLLPGNLEAILLWMDAAREELKGSALSQPQRLSLIHIYCVRRKFL